jgi:hypothetical protein
LVGKEAVPAAVEGTHRSSIPASHPDVTVFIVIGDIIEGVK